MTTEKKEVLARRMLEAIDEEICESFCPRCEAREVTPSTFDNPWEEHCPADFMPGDPGCVKAERYKDLLYEAIKLVEGMEVV